MKKILFIMLFTGTAWGSTLQVSPTGAFRAIQSAVDNAKPGDTVLIHAGTYRETVNVTGDSLEITAAPNEDVIVTGADPISTSEWVEEPGKPVWRHTPWTYQGVTHPNDEFHHLIGRTEQVIADGKLLQQVLQQDQMQAGTFCADEQAKALFVWLPDGSDPSQHHMEASVRPVLMNITGHRDTISHIRFRYASNRAQQATLNIDGSDNLVDDCTVEWTNGNGADLGGERNMTRRLVSRFNGQMGMSGRGTANRMEQCTLEGNNVKGFSKNWEAGGIKVWASRGFQIVRCIAIRNDGPGFWFDTDNRNELVEDSYAAENDGMGIFIEISETAVVRNNLCVRNGLKDERGDWGHAGITIGESMHCIVEHNVCVGNRTGIEVRQIPIRSVGPSRREDRAETKLYYSDQLIFRNNISAFNKDWQFALFGDNVFFGAKPKAHPEVANQDLNLLDPDQRNWHSGNNLYYAAPGEGLILWGAKWLEKHTEFQALPTFEAQHHLEEGSIVADPLFVNWENGDFSLEPSSPAKGIGAGFTEMPVVPANNFSN